MATNQLIPKRPKSGFANNGSAAATIERMNVFAADGLVSNVAFKSLLSDTAYLLHWLSTCQPSNKCTL